MPAHQQIIVAEQLQVHSEQTKDKRLGHRGNDRQRKKGQSKFNSFLSQDRNLQRWYDNLKRGSAYTADVYFRRVCNFCLVIGKTPDEFQKLPQIEIDEKAQDYINQLEDMLRPNGKRYAPQYVDSNLKAIKSWADWNNKRIAKKIKIANTSFNPTLENEQAPTPEQLAMLLYAPTTDTRTRASISLIALAGGRLQIQGNKEGRDGLMIRDIPDLKILTDESGRQKEVAFTQLPALIIVRSPLSKTRRQYFTMAFEECSDLIKTYLDERIKNGEVLTNDSPIITVSPSSIKIVRNLYSIDDKDPFLSTNNVSKHIRKAMRAVGIPYRLYVWRSYFDTRLMHAESLQLITHAYAQFFMGHKGDIERTYTLNKHNLPPDVMEGIRQAAKRAQKVIQTRVPKEDIVTVEDAKAIGKETWFTSLGFTKEEIQNLNLLHVEGPELQKALRQKLQGLLAENGKKQKVVPAEEVRKCLEEGWEYTATLPTGQCIVRLPDL
ncbi:MAG: hypothetical protein ACRDF4_10575 [Rhabdochlamydiaceae bacterium]